MLKFIISTPIAPGRAENTDKSELITEFLFGDIVRVLDQNGTWVKVVADFDEYPAWIDKKMISEVKNELSTSIRVINPLQQVETSSGIMHLPLGAKLYPGVTVDRAYSADEKHDPLHWALRFLNAPYRWGGKTILGMDCSGLTQVAFSMAGVDLPRDAWQQAEQGETIPFVELAQTNDLAFFDNQEGKIIHVGIVADELDGRKQIIHASGKVRVDALDHQGIFKEEEGRYSHNLRFIKRIRI
jgi:cell wall-associated NlpC family hydrolase